MQRLPTLQPQQQQQLPSQQQPVAFVQSGTSSAGLLIHSTATSLPSVVQSAGAIQGVVQSSGALQPALAGVVQSAPAVQPVVSPQKGNMVVGIQPLGQNTVSFKVK